MYWLAISTAPGAVHALSGSRKPGRACRRAKRSNGFLGGLVNAMGVYVCDAGGIDRSLQPARGRALAPTSAPTSSTGVWIFHADGQRRTSRRSRDCYYRRAGDRESSSMSMAGFTSDNAEPLFDDHGAAGGRELHPSPICGGRNMLRAAGWSQRVLESSPVAIWADSGVLWASIPPPPRCGARAEIGENRWCGSQALWPDDRRAAGTPMAPAFANGGRSQAPRRFSNVPAGAARSIRRPCSTPTASWWARSVCWWITERKRAEISRCWIELNHRVKNTLATVSRWRPQFQRRGRSGRDAQSLQAG